MAQKCAVCKACVDTHVMNPSGPMMHYIMCGDIQSLKSQIQKRADVNIGDDTGFTTLMFAASGGFANAIEILIKAGANVNAVDNSHKSALHYATHHGHEECISFLINAGADVNNVTVESFTNVKGMSSLMIASMNGFTDCVELLLREGADVSIANNNGINNVICAAANGHNDIIELLLQAGADVNSSDTSGATVLTYAVRSQSLMSVRTLLNAGADVNKGDKDNVTPVMWAIKYPNDGCVIRLINAGAHVNGDIFIWASRRGYLESVNKCMDAGLDVNYVDTHGTTPLIAAVEGHRFVYNQCNLKFSRIIKCLLSKGANVNFTSKDGKTTLMMLICLNCSDCVKSLIRAGADVNTMPIIGETPLFVALDRARDEIIPWSLMSAGAKVNVVYNDGNTTMHKECIVYRDHAHSTPFSVCIDLQDAPNRNKAYWSYSESFKCHVTRSPLVGGEEHPHTPLSEVLGTPNWRLCLMNQCRVQGSDQETNDSYEST